MPSVLAGKHKGGDGRINHPAPPSTISLTLVKYPPQWVESKSVAKFKNTFNADLFISRSACTMESFPLQKLFQNARLLFILLHLNI